MKQVFKIAFSSVIISVSLILLSCNPAIKSTDTIPQTPEVVQNNQQQELEESNKVFKFKRDAGTEAFSIKLAENGAKLIDGSEKELARFTVDEKQKVKIKSAADETLGYIVPKTNGWKVKNPSQTREIYSFQAQTDGDYKLKDEDNKEIYRIKRREYGYEIESPTKESIYKIKVKGGKISLINNLEQTVVYTSSNLTPIAVTCFGFDVLSIEQQAALAYAMNL